MSGSLVLRSGVGTQMLMVSSSRTAEKSVVARSLPDLTRPASVALGNIADVGIAGVDAARLFVADVDSGHGESGLGELHRQRQADVSQPDDSDPRRARARIFSSSIFAVVSSTVWVWDMATLHFRMGCLPNERPKI